ncbi:PP2C family protein-serine/threonine phosphatase [Streptomyces sp. NPDC006997]|uniref:PP2C family protein-serine/threonine phosphatase n=1 Tax=Streptomyces sp. NPDC006997 TaxID=3155356 RepID=UPI0033C63B3C
MTTFDGSSPPARPLPVNGDAAWLGAPYPALVAEAGGSVVEINHAAGALFPDARGGAPMAGTVPDWLAEAHLRVTGGTDVEAPVARGTHGGLTLAAHPTVAVDGAVTWWLVDDTDRLRAEAALHREQERAAFLTDASSRLLASLNSRRCMEVTVELAAQHLADAAVLVAPRTGRRHALALGAAGTPVTHVMAQIDADAVPGLAEALQGFPPVPSRWIDPAALPQWAVPDAFGGPVGSVVVTPLPGHGVPAGALILLRRSDQAAFDPSEEVFARVFSARAGAALSAARLYTEQTRITATLMEELLPPTLRQVDGVEFAGAYRASREIDRIGGDFYDVHPMSGTHGETLAVLGDVCGKGLDAAVLTGKIRNTLQAMLPMADDHATVLELLNGALLNGRHTRFASLVLVSVRREGHLTRLRVTSAGHPRPLVVRNTGVVEETATSGTIVGALPDITATTVGVELAPGETCLLFTDGITEARGGPLRNAFFGGRRLRGALAHCAGMPAEAVVEHIRMLASEWIGDNPHDDMALMAITTPRNTHLTAVDGHTPGRYTG